MLAPSTIRVCVGIEQKKSVSVMGIEVGVALTYILLDFYAL